MAILRFLCLLLPNNNHIMAVYPQCCKSNIFFETNHNLFVHLKIISTGITMWCLRSIQRLNFCKLVLLMRVPRFLILAKPRPLPQHSHLTWFQQERQFSKPTFPPTHNKHACVVLKILGTIHSFPYTSYCGLILIFIKASFLTVTTTSSTIAGELYLFSATTFEWYLLFHSNFLLVSRPFWIIATFTWIHFFGKWIQFLLVYSSPSKWQQLL
jgi:hypothetical protein